ncbi:hypothetical protein HEB94_006709 [Actinopolymorpha pittospori]|uniref:Uncharacterized protein n=1 Tax=Actinopolymorpha pittospori TaxID=648752 RepID=A0A927MZJ6_9ACTN|nr:hypothetical protein [Actinopolymorpha pittospori]
MQPHRTNGASLYAGSLPAMAPYERPLTPGQHPRASRSSGRGNPHAAHVPVLRLCSEAPDKGCSPVGRTACPHPGSGRGRQARNVDRQAWRGDTLRRSGYAACGGRPEQPAAADRPGPRRARGLPRVQWREGQPGGAAPRAGGGARRSGGLLRLWPGVPRGLRLPRAAHRPVAAHPAREAGPDGHPRGRSLFLVLPGEGGMVTGGRGTPRCRRGRGCTRLSCRR